VKRFLKILIVVLTVTGLAYALLRWLDVVRYEKMKTWLYGPFPGVVQPQPPQVPLSSAAAICRDVTLMAFPADAESDGPVLALRSSEGKVLWCRKIVLRPEGGQGRDRLVRKMLSLDLVSVRKTQQGYEVLFRSSWRDGQQQEGIVRLGESLAFRDFWIELSDPGAEVPSSGHITRGVRD
jgi:hypothetical protein